jgi:hypothetical protein
MTSTFSRSELEELEKSSENFPYVTGRVVIGLEDVISADMEWFLDEISEQLVGSILLMDVNYTAVGVTEGGSLVLEVSGDVSAVLDD